MSKCDKCICEYCEKRTDECHYGNCNSCRHAHPALCGNPSYFSGICRNKKVKSEQKIKKYKGNLKGYEFNHLINSKLSKEEVQECCRCIKPNGECSEFAEKGECRLYNKFYNKISGDK